MSINDWLALAILEIVALLFPFIALMFQAFIPDDVSFTSTSDHWLAKIDNPREVARFVIFGLTGTAALALGSFWSHPEISNWMKGVLMVFAVVLSSILLLTSLLVDFNRRANDTLHEAYQE